MRGFSRSDKGLLARGLLVFALAMVAAPTYSQLAYQAFEYVISKHGQRCDAVTRTQAIGTGSNGDALVAVACSNGGEHVVSIRKDNALSYMTSCASLESRAGIRCFDSSAKE
ncbi:hypothetical protein [Thiocystis violacea]|uniref:hypothetical protein n=1 Tax=Thiocystis violacea TaxID=13725 RepID=UPI0019081161|nr:hypothetical protein [Thiocystis violacea]MBK1719388.1 hypothetical protein [Thiocystis violacea]